MKKIITVAVIMVAVVLLTGINSSAQDDKVYDQYIQLLRKDLRSEKKQHIAANLGLSDAEAVKFWPVYDQYTSESIKLYDARLNLVKEFAASYEKLNDVQAADLNKRSIDIDLSLSRLRQKYVPLVTKVLPGKKSALFFQLDKRFGLLLDLQLAAEIPLVTP